MADEEPPNGGPVGGQNAAAVDKIGTIEDVLNTVLGFAIGSGTGGSAAIDESLRPQTIADSGGPWFKPEERFEHSESSLSYKPSQEDGAVKFWRWMENLSGGHVEGLTVRIYNQSGGDDDAKNNYDMVGSEGKDTTDPVNKVGGAWQPVALEISKIVGMNTPFDSRYLGYIHDVLEAVGIWADQLWRELDADATSIDSGAANFKGSAAEAFRDLVTDAKRGPADVVESSRIWNEKLKVAQAAAAHFEATLIGNAKAWQQGVISYDANGNGTGDGSPFNTWIHPLYLIRNMFEGSVVREVDGGNLNHSGGLWGEGRIRGGDSQYEDENGQTRYKIMIIEFPLWSGVSPANGNQDPYFDVLREWTWHSIDKQTRAAWADHVKKAFAPTLVAAADLVKALDAATAGMTLPDIAPPIPPRQPNLSLNNVNIPGIDINIPPININIPNFDLNIPELKIDIPNFNLNLGPGPDGSNVNIPPDANSNINIPNINIPGNGDPTGGGADLNLDNIKSNFDNINSDLNNINGYLGDNNKNLSALSDGLNDGLNALAIAPPGGSSGLGGNSGLNNLSSLNNSDDPETLGDLTSPEIQSLLDQGLLDDTPLTDEQRAELGLPPGGAETLGDLTPDQLAQLQSAGLLNNVPLTPQQLTALGATSGLSDPGEGLDDLGDLNQEQLAALKDAGLLDSIPLTDEDLAELQKQGLLGSGSLNDLGDLNPEQLAALKDAGLLDSIPTTQAQLNALDAAGLLDSTAGLPNNLGDITPQQLADLDAANLLDDNPITPEQIEQLQQDGLLGSDISGINSLGDLTPEQLNDLQNHNLLDDVPITADETAALGLNDNGLMSTSLGDLGPNQLADLDGANLLDDNPITPEQIEQLQQDGLLGSDTSGINSLGDLTPEQLNDLQNHNLLDDVPITADETAALGLNDNGVTLTSAGNANGLGGNLGLGGGGTATSAFPTNIDGVDVSPQDLSNPGVKVGDLSVPGHTPLSFGGGGGGMTGGGISSGGLRLPGEAMPVAKTVDSLGDFGLQRAPGTGAIGGPGSGLGAGANDPTAQGTGMGGMPMMPMGGMGGGGGGGQGAKERERTTWLTEDDKVWGTDPDCAPAVVGRGGDGADEEFSFEEEVKPERPGAPKRGGIRRGQ